jgi:hypothetical protein
MAKLTVPYIFFSTPHYGIPHDQVHHFFHYVLRMPAPLRSNMESISIRCENISEDFEVLASYLGLVSFIESQPMKGLSRVVSCSSS